MKIRTQNLLSIVPLFLSLGLVSSALMVKVERDEYRWGLQEQATSLAAATAEFLPRELFSDPANDRPAALRGKLCLSLERIVRQRQARRIFALSADGQSEVLSHPRLESDVLLPPEALATLETGECHVSEPSRDQGGQTTMTAYSPILDGKGKRLGVLGVEIDASDTHSLMRQLVRRSAWIIGSVLLLGVGAALGISRAITRELRDLTRAAVEVKDGNLDRQVRAGRIQEIDDLANTFNTMTDVLKDVLARTRRSMLEGEQFRTRADLAQTYVERFCPPLSATLEDVMVRARLLGKRASGSFLGAFPTRDGACAVIGRVREGEALDAAVAASAACSLLQQDLVRRDPGEALAELIELFSCETLECVMWSERAETAERWSLMAGSGTLARQSLPWASGARVVLHTLGPEAQEKIEPYLSLFDDASPDEVMEDLAAVLPSGRDGCLMVLSKG